MKVLKITIVWLLLYFICVALIDSFEVREWTEPQLLSFLCILITSGLVVNYYEDLQEEVGKINEYEEYRTNNKHKYKL